MEIQLRELSTKEEMLARIDMMRHLYPTFTIEKYDTYLTEMIPHNYKQLAVFEGDVCLGYYGFLARV